MNKTSTQKKFSTEFNTNETKSFETGNEMPAESVINNILNYSKALSIKKSKNLEHFEIVLN